MMLAMQGVPRRAAVSVVLALLTSAAVMLAAGCGDAERVGETSGGGGEAGSVAGAAVPRLLDLGSDTCVPCKAMAPILEEMRATFAGKLSVEFVDVWKDRGAAETYQIKVIPTQIFFDAEGNELFRHQGFFSREDMLAKWRELGYEFEG